MPASNGMTPLVLFFLFVFGLPANAYWRMSCPGTLFTGRVDPIIAPGAVASHVHIVLGGNGFAPTMDFASTQKSTCTSCTIKGDMSNYWVPALYYQFQNGSFTNVPLVNGGGGTVYYQQRAYHGTNKAIKAFQPGHRMVAGDPYNRNTSATVSAQKAITFACLDYSGRTNYPEGQLLPTVPCPNGVRAQVYFPSCWDGVNLDSHDHQSHMAYPDGENNGNCPDTHPVPVISLFYEFLFDTGPFPFHGNTQPFVFAMGDPTGRGFHGDFVSGWDPVVLQRGIDRKTTQDFGAVGDVTYNGIFEYPDHYGADCTLPPLVDEQIDGVMPTLPGCNPVERTAADAVPVQNCAATRTLAVQTEDIYTDVTNTLGWKYLGCGKDAYGANALPTKIADTRQMTVEGCIKSCSGAGYSIAGLEYASQCFCGNALPASASPLPGVVGGCTMRCTGNSKELCGQANRLSLYQKCNGGSCTNAAFPFVGEIGSLGTSSGSKTPSQGDAPNAPPSGPSSLTSPTAAAAAAPSTKTTPTAPSAPPPSSSSSDASAALPAGWTPAGCYSDSLADRALKGVGLADYGRPVTTANCAAYCDGRGFAISGTEYGSQCFCGNSLDGGAVRRADTDCAMPCAGDARQTCGGSLRLSVATRKSGGMRRREHLRRHRGGELADAVMA